MENPSLGITVCHHSASLVMPNGDPQDNFFNPTLTLMIDSYNPLLVFSGDRKIPTRGHTVPFENEACQVSH